MRFSSVQPVPNLTQGRGLRLILASVFTTDDSILYVAVAPPQVTVCLYRDDGATAVLLYPSQAATGFRQLINRWCMLAPIDDGTATAAQPTGENVPVRTPAE